MILTVTPNAALDRILFIDEFRPGTVMRPQRWLDKVGGKGLDTSVGLRAFGVDTLAVSILAGDVGRRLVELLDGYGIRHDIVWVGGQTRISHVLVETHHRRHSHIIAGGPTVPPAAAAEFLQRAEQHTPQAEFAVAGGSLAAGLPGNIYRHIIERARAAGVPLLLDVSGPPVQAVLAAPPDILKMNWGEFERTFGAPASTLVELSARAAQVAARHNLPALVLTCGREGLLAVTSDGLFHAAAPPQKAVNAAGAGDVASGVLAWRRSLGEPWPDALRFAAAAGAASVLTEGTADCNPLDVERILPHTSVRGETSR